MIKAIIFDADGVLLDNTEIFIREFIETGRKLNLRIPTIPSVRKVFGLTYEDILIRLYGRKDKKIKETYSEVIRNRGQEKIMENLEYVIKRLKVRKAIVTSRSLKSLKRNLKDLIKLFEVVITIEDTEKHKPDPEPILLACKKLGIKPEETVYVGDAVIDYKAAKNAGTSFIGFVSGSASKEDFESLKVKSVSSLKELLGMFQ
jgi:pyrophosphatase PpaX